MATLYRNFRIMKADVWCCIINTVKRGWAGGGGGGGGGYTGKSQSNGSRAAR